MSREKHFSWAVFTGLVLLFSGTNLNEEETLLIDDRRNDDIQSSIGSPWRLIADSVMGGVSDGSLLPDSIDGKSCLRLRGTVQLENSGGFIQAALDIGQTQASNASGYGGLMLEVYGKDER